MTFNGSRDIQRWRHLPSPSVTVKLLSSLESVSCSNVSQRPAEQSRDTQILRAAPDFSDDITNWPNDKQTSTLLKREIKTKH